MSGLARRTALCALLGLVLLTAGCATQPGENQTAQETNDSVQDVTDGGQAATVADLLTTDGDIRAGVLGSDVRLSGFVTFANLDQGLQQTYGDAYASTSEQVQRDLPAATTWSVGLFLEEDFIADIEDPRRIVSEHGAVVALPNFTEPQNRVHYVSFQGQVLDLTNLTEASDRSSSVPLVVADTYDLLQPRTVDLQTLQRDFDTITEERIATHLGTRSFAMGTTLKHAQEAASEDGSSSEEIPFDVGVYDALNASGTSGSVESFHLPVVTLQRGQGQELLGDQVRIEGFLVSEDELSAEAQQRVPQLRELAERWTNLRKAGNAYQEAAEDGLENPYLSRLVEEGQETASRQHRIPAYFLAYKIEKLPPVDFHPLQDLVPQPFREDRLLVHLETEGYLTGTTAETVCKAAEPECELPYDVGAYHLFNFTVGGDRLPTITQVPVVFPAKEIPFPLNATAGLPVSFDGAWVTESLARDRIQATVQQTVAEDSLARRLIAGPQGPAAERVQTADGFLYAFNLEPFRLLHVPPAPVVVWNETTPQGPVVKWTRCVGEDFSHYEVHQAHRRVFRPTEQTLATTIGTCSTTSYQPTNLDTQGRYVRVWVYDQDNLRTPSNAVFVGDGTTQSEYRSSQGFIELEAVTRCPGKPASCLDVSWRAETTDGFEAFRIERTTNATDWSIVATSQDESQRHHRDEMLTCGTEYSYRVTLVGSGETLVSDVRSKTPYQPGGSCPSEQEPRVSLESVTRCTDAPDTCLRASWTADTTDAFERFEVERKPAGGTWSVVEATQDPSDRSYRDEGLDCGTEHTYRVRLYGGGQVVESGTMSEMPRPPSGYCY